MLGPGRYSHSSVARSYGSNFLAFKLVLEIKFCPLLMLANSANEIWIAIERLQQGSLNEKDCKVQSVLGIWEVYFRDGESMESFTHDWSRFVTVGSFGNQRDNEQVLELGKRIGVPLQVEQADWLEDTDEEIDEQELEAHYSFMAKIQEVLPDVILFQLKQPIGNWYQTMMKIMCLTMKDNILRKILTECTDERAALANLIANLTLDTEENKTIFNAINERQTHHMNHETRGVQN
ncbi:hypothetical protein Tco_1029810 [Tanacetum coccineum]|uniref:Uncharacterized protein n=1 Tax=Tanacetum coccineum TaxID=301880 RepID=A0ABQ5G4K6_9ASTR